MQALDPDLRIKMLERDSEPATIEDALRVACRLEAIRRTADDERLDEVKNREKNIRAVEVKSPVSNSNETTAANGETEQRVKGLETTVSEYRNELERMRLLTQQL